MEQQLASAIQPPQVVATGVSAEQARALQRKFAEVVQAVVGGSANPDLRRYYQSRLTQENYIVSGAPEVTAAILSQSTKPPHIQQQIGRNITPEADRALRANGVYERTTENRGNDPWGRPQPGGDKVRRFFSRDMVEKDGELLGYFVRDYNRFALGARRTRSKSEEGYLLQGCLNDLQEMEKKFGSNPEMLKNIRAATAKFERALQALGSTASETPAAGLALNLPARPTNGVKLS